MEQCRAKVDDGYLIRAACESDASGIADLYAEAYSVGDSGANEHYPFTQFLDAAWVAKAVNLATICWIVCEKNGEIVGTAGAVRNIGSADDRVSESFGLVVRRQHRRHGIGFRVFNELTRVLRKESRVVIAETRTADPGGWMVIRRCGFVPIGFEPYAHATPAGRESMLLTACLPDEVLAHGRIASGTVAANSLGTRVLQSAFRPGHASFDCSIGNGDYCFDTVERQEKPVCAFSDVGLHVSGVVGLERLVGEGVSAPRRYYHTGFVCRHANSIVGRARLTVDLLDRRVRILGMQVIEENAVDPFFKHVVDEAEMLLDDGDPMVVVVDVRADRPNLQRILENAGFIPTAYYPGLIGDEESRPDCVQYTRLRGYSIEQSISDMPELSSWERAWDVVGAVTGQQVRGEAS